MGIAYLLAFISGAFLITIGTHRLIDDMLTRADLMEALIALSGGIFVIILAGVLLSVVASRRDDEGMLSHLEPMGWRGFVTASVLWLGPLIWAWIQFERFVTPVELFPKLSIIGACAFAFGVTQHAFKKSRFRTAMSTTAIALFGIPAGVLSVALPTAHFNHHLTPVKTSTYGAGQDMSFHPLLLEDPRRDDVTSILDEETAGLLSALANAEPVEIDVQAEIEAGRARLEDGSLVLLDEEGEPIPRANLDDLFDSANSKDDEASDRARTEEIRRFDAMVRERSQGGRIFDGLF